MKKLFIVGCPRSGTTLLQTTLNRHPRLIIPPETAFFTDLVGHTRTGQRRQIRRINGDLKINLPPIKRRLRGDAETRILFDEMTDQFVRRYDRSNLAYFGEKTPWHQMHTDRISRLFPDAKFLLIYRDGRDVASSISKMPWGPTDLFVNFSTWLRFLRRQRLLELRGAIDLMCVKYEDLASKPNDVLQRICRFLDIEYADSMTSGANVIEAFPEREHIWKARTLDEISITSQGEGRFRQNRKEIGRLEAWGGSALTSLGYDLWVDERCRLPRTFFAQLAIHQTLWRVRALGRLIRQETLGF